PVELEDLVAEGMIGLMRAADQFDLSQTVRFSTYARWWVMTSVATALARMKSLVDMPPRTYLDARMGRLTGAERDMALQALHGQVNIDALVRGESGLHSHDLASPDMTPEEHAEAMSSAALLRRVMNDAVGTLGDPDAEVLRRHRLNAVPETIEEIAEAMGLSRDRVRQIERRAMTRLKLSLQRLGYTPAMLH
ncbi:sigma-70 family RNA polymerase sigma factor, partial [Thioclava sp. BHET1]